MYPLQQLLSPMAPRFSSKISATLVFSRKIHSRVLSEEMKAKILTSSDPKHYSVADFLNFTKSPKQNLVESLLYEEAPVRMSSIIQSLPKIFMKEVRTERSYHFIEDYFHMNYKDIEDLKSKNVPVSQMLSIVRHIETRLGGTTEMVSDAVLNSDILHNKDHIEKIQEDIVKLFKQNLSVEVLVSLVSSHLSGKFYLEENLELKKSVESAYDNARYLCEQYYISSPELELTGDTECQLTYFPSHLYLIFFELIKNSLRASVEHHGVESEHLPPVVVDITHEVDTIIVTLSDSGGGYHKGDIQSLFKFFNTSASINSMSLYQGAHSSPLAGYGFGLGMVKIYLEHFGGKISLMNTEKGMNAVLEFQRDPRKGL